MVASEEMRCMGEARQHSAWMGLPFGGMANTVYIVLVRGCVPQIFGS